MGASEQLRARFVAPEQEPWDRLKKETHDQFRQFLCFRNLFPNRSIEKAFRIWREANPGDQAGPNPPKKSSGPFRETADKNFWRERAVLWDERNLKADDLKAYKALSRMVRRLSEMALEQLDNVKIESVDDAVKVLQCIRTFLPDPGELRDRLSDPKYDVPDRDDHDPDDPIPGDATSQTRGSDPGQDPAG